MWVILLIQMLSSCLRLLMWRVCSLRGGFRILVAAIRGKFVWPFVWWVGPGLNCWINVPLALILSPDSTWSILSSYKLKAALFLPHIRFLKLNGFAPGPSLWRKGRLVKMIKFTNWSKSTTIVIGSLSHPPQTNWKARKLQK